MIDIHGMIVFLFSKSSYKQENKNLVLRMVFDKGKDMILIKNIKGG
jgi:hypothetical protein